MQSYLPPFLGGIQDTRQVLENRFKNSICEMKKSYTKSRQGLIFLLFQKWYSVLFEIITTHTWFVMKWKKYIWKWQTTILLPAGASELNELVNYKKLLSHYQKSEAASSNGLDIVCLIKKKLWVKVLFALYEKINRYSWDKGNAAYLE